MEPEELKQQSAFITYRELSFTQDKIREELLKGQTALKEEFSLIVNGVKKDLGKVDNKVNHLDDKVDDLKTLVLPLLEATKQTAINTEKMSLSMDKFIESQRVTNGNFHEKINGQAIVMEGLKHIAGGVVEKKKFNAAIIVAIITTVGGIVMGIIQLAPFIFPK